MNNVIIPQYVYDEISKITSKYMFQTNTNQVVYAIETEINAALKKAYLCGVTRLELISAISYESYNGSNLTIRFYTIPEMEQVDMVVIGGEE